MNHQASAHSTPSPPVTTKAPRQPTAAISVRQVAEVLDLIRRLRDQGVAVILISHRMPDVFAVCDHVSVMRRGAVVADKPIIKPQMER